MSEPRDDQIEKLRKLARENGLAPELIGDEHLADALNSARPKVRLPGDNRELGLFAKEIGEICKNKDLFRRDITPVVINDEKKRLDIVTAEMLRTWVELHLVCFKDKSIGSGDKSFVIEIFKTMNVDTSRGTIASWQFWSQLPEIQRVNATRLPVIRRDGQIMLLRPGYFHEQGIYTLEDDLTYNEEMTLDEAKGVIDDLLCEFPYHDNGRSKAVQIAAMLTMFCASMLPKRSLRPGFIYTANSVTAGKTLGAKIAIIPVAGACSTRTFPRKEEAKKVLDSMAMDAASYILFDNIRGKIAGEEIEAFITSTEWEGRILGESTKFRVENVATVFMTGNQSTTSPDMASRCLFIELFVEEADISQRKIKRTIDDNFLSSTEERSRICSALWSLVRAWDAAGRPPAPSILPRFETWSNVVAAIIAHAGYGDALEKPNIAGAEDPEARDMRQLVIALGPNKTVDRMTWKFDEIMPKVRELGLFEELDIRPGKDGEQEMFSSEGNVSPAARSHFGKMFAKFHERLFAGEAEEDELAPERLRFLVEGKGNGRRFVVVRQPV